MFGPLSFLDLHCFHAFFCAFASHAVLTNLSKCLNTCGVANSQTVDALGWVGGQMPRRSMWLQRSKNPKLLKAALLCTSDSRHHHDIDTTHTMRGPPYTQTVYQTRHQPQYMPTPKQLASKVVSGEPDVQNIARLLLVEEFLALALEQAFLEEEKVKVYAALTARANTEK